MADQDRDDGTTSILGERTAVLNLIAISIALSAFKPEDVRRVLNGDIKNLANNRGKNVSYPDIISDDDKERAFETLAKTNKQIIDLAKDFVDLFDKALQKQ